MTSTQKVVGTLRKNGFKAAKIKVREEGNIITEGYKVSKVMEQAHVECYHCMSQKDAMKEALEAEGLTVIQARINEILIVV